VLHRNGKQGSFAMASILPLSVPDQILHISDQSFDAETTELICNAFDKTCKELHDSGQPDSVKEVIAKRIIEIAGRGERDPDKMCEAALISLGLKRNRFAF
jgi:hypothetical protein